MPDHLEDDVPTATIDEFDLDIRIESLDPQLATPAPMVGRSASRPWSDICCTDWCDPTSLC
jgi:hypothetical protein